MRTTEEINNKIKELETKMCRCKDERWYDLVDEYLSQINLLRWVLEED